MNETLKLGLVLLIVTAVSATILGISNFVTADKIAEADKLANDSARKEALSVAEDFELLIEETEKIKKINPEVLEIYEGLDGSGETIGYVIKTEVLGFGGDIEVMTGISLEGKITGMKVLDHAETPGLGARATEPEFQEKFNDKSVDESIVVVNSEPVGGNEVLAITSATITTDAVAQGVNIAREIFVDNFAK
ncbi:MAG TPA: RnfABCDGE type electron transport complex subunit G [Tissierellales bacterium]|nr:RnfABCDGE type electron transport complex subunit G [Tissierellales bacterium]